MTSREWLNLLRELQSLYSEATSTISGRITAYTAKYLAQDAIKRKLLKSGILDKNKYGLWIKNNVFKGFRWKTVLFDIVNTIINANRRAHKIIDEQQNRDFQDGANRQLYDIETKTGVNTGEKPLTGNDVIDLLRDYPELLPRRKEDLGKARGWQQEKIATSIAQSIILGEGLVDTAKRLSETLGMSNMKTMIRYARTATTCARNAGQLEGMRRAARSGIHIQKKWLATLDERTRDSHRDLDGQVREIEEDFRSLLGRIAYPGDITANPADVWNCRCTMTSVYPDFSDLMKPGERRENTGNKRTLVPEMTYREWENYKKTGEAPKKPGSKLWQKIKQVGKNLIQAYTPDKYDQEAQGIQDQIDQLNQQENALLGRYRPLYSGEEKHKIGQELSDIFNQRAKLYTEKERYAVEDVAKGCQKDGVEFVPVEKLNQPRTEEEIIRILAGGDRTGGSCASLGFAYAGQKAGLDVRDFRGGDSRYKFSHYCVDLLKSFEANGLPMQKNTARSYITAGKHTLASVEEGKQYYFECASHAAIVRKTEGKLEYLELQSGVKNGWKPFNDIASTLNWRFGAPKSSQGYDVESYMIDMDTLTANQRFMKLMGYINTRPEDQQKGAGGHEK